MAPKDTELKIGNISYEEKPLEFCQAIYDEAQKRQDDLAPYNEENRLFYEGIDESLRERGANTRVKRSSLFVHEATPAIETRIGDIISRLEEDSGSPLFVNPNFDNLTGAEKDQLVFIEQQLNRDLRESGYLTDVFREHILAAEIYRTPSTVKVGWGRGHRMVPEAVIPSQAEMDDALLSGKVLKPKVRFVKKPINGPFVDWLPPDEFLYEPNRSDFYRTSRYAIHPRWVTWDELFAEAIDEGWEDKYISQLRKFKEEVGATETGKTGESHQEKIESAKETPFRLGYKNNRVLITENYITTFDPLGREKVNLAIVVGNKILVRNKESVYMAIKFPFVPITANRMPGTIEGLSSIDKVKSMQKLNNEVYNAWIDGASYRIFTPFKVGPGFQMKNQPIYGPAEIWHCSDPNDFQPVVDNIGDLPDLAALSTTVANKIRQVLAGAADLNQGFNATQYEKATSTSLRAQGSARRATATYKNYGEAIIKVAEMFLALNQQFHEEGHRFVMDVSLDVPSLTNVLDPAQETNNALMVHQLLAQDPLYQSSKIGRIKLNNLNEYILRLVLRRKVDEFKFSAEELEQVLQAEQLAKESAIVERQAAQDMEIAQAQGAQ